MNPAHRAIAESLLTHIAWQDDRLGYCKCPGESQHNSPTKPDHCRITMDGVPTIFCFHSSCSTDVEQANHVLRSAIAKYDYHPDPKLPRPAPHIPTPEEIAAKREKQEMERIKEHAKKSLQIILQQNAIDLAEWFELSPCRLLDDPAEDWRLLLSLFDGDDVVWIGQTTDSCGDHKPEHLKVRCRTHFRTVNDWNMAATCPAQFTCPSVFKPGIHSRSNENIIARKFFVMESDCLTKDQMSAVINWCRQFMKLRAIVDTAGKSLHGWFDCPTPAVESELKIILPNLGKEGKENTIDPALFKLAQPVRLPGAMRDDRRQCLLYLDNLL